MTTTEIDTTKTSSGLPAPRVMFLQNVAYH